jgi:hypothetical protein
MHRIVLAPLAAVLSATPLMGQDRRPGLYEKTQVHLSVTTLIIDSDIRVDGNSGPGTDLDAEDDLGVSKVKVMPRASFRWRPGRRHELEVGYQFARRTGDKVLERNIIIGDTLYMEGTQLATTYNTDYPFLTYRFALLANDRTQLGLGAGVGSLLVDFETTAILGGTESSQTNVHTNAAVGSVGLYARFLSGARWHFELDLRYLEATIDRLHPTVVEWNGAARYAFAPRVELEAGYGGSAIDVIIDPESGKELGEFGPGGRVQYGVQHLRLGLIWTP